MNVLILGDIVGDAGCEYVSQKLGKLKEQYKSDLVIVNGENASEGNGILPSSAEMLRNNGVDIITLGNHGLRRKEIYPLLDKMDGIIRPANYHADSPGAGYYIYDGLKYKVCVINLQGNVYLNSYGNAFDVVDSILKEVDCKNIIVDFHAEATSEKVAMGLYLDGRASVVVGTHTHVPTADARVLPKGTGYITDLGMCGSIDSVLGVKAENAIGRLRTNLPTRFANEKENIKISGVSVTIDIATGVCTNIESFVFV